MFHLKIYKCHSSYTSIFIRIFLSVLFIQNAFSLSPADREKIGLKIWKNECGGKIEGLTSWNRGENFPSLGIGHFIWYPEGVTERFEETFPALLQFLEKQGVALPVWLKRGAGCPWSSRDHFYEEIHSEKMETLRNLLVDTRGLQAQFMADRLEKTLPQLSEKALRHLSILKNDPNGLFALIDYLNFKGSGMSEKERYKGKGWGLLQVLERMPNHSKEPLKDFVTTAKSVLKERVDNAPPERGEEKWLQGWLNRLDNLLK